MNAEPEESTEAGIANDLLIVDAGHELFTGEQKLLADQAALSWFREHLLE